MVESALSGGPQGPEAAAVLLMVLDDGEAAELLSHLDPAEVQQLGSALEAVAPGFKGAGQAALMRVGEELQTMGNQQALMQEEHGQKMGVSKTSLQEGDEDAAAGLSAIDALSL